MISIRRITTGLIIGCLATSLGCTSVKPIELSPKTLQAQLRNGELIEAGDRVVITTVDARRERFTVRSIGEGAIHAWNRKVDIGVVETLAVRRFSTPKTIATVIGFGAVFYLILSTSAAPGLPSFPAN